MSDPIIDPTVGVDTLPVSSLQQGELVVSLPPCVSPTTPPLAAATVCRHTLDVWVVNRQQQQQFYPQLYIKLSARSLRQLNPRKLRKLGFSDKLSSLITLQRVC